MDLIVKMSYPFQQNLNKTNIYKKELTNENILGTT